ncbi:15376_t:CDS:2 [Racocetra persica]|uniref:15376_t:CDS:1 n=1 Tax=Racocetra persica TaxID=160502 RepID=A0ACA9PHY7_9GLOM|nr:15376_t:CDS:2 [Racocetra persica]
MPTPKLTPQKLEEIKRREQLHVRGDMTGHRYDYGLQSFAENVRYYVNQGDNEQAKKERSNQVKRDLINCCLNPRTRQFIQDNIAKIEPYFEGNQSDGREPSPRLQAVESYYSMICVMREILEVIEQEIGREQLNRNFGEERGRQMFNDIFAEGLLRGREEIPPSNQNRGEGNPPQNDENNNIPDDIPRPEENREQRGRSHSPAREAGEQQARGERPDTPPKFDFGSSTLNDILNGMSEELEKDGKAAGNDEPFTPSPGLAKNLGTAEKPIKGFQRLVKDDDLPTEREGEKNHLLITGKREDDKRAEKMGWTA